MRSLFVSLLRDVIIPSPKSSFDLRVVKHVNPNSSAWRQFTLLFDLILKSVAVLTLSTLKTDVLKLS